MYLSGTGPVGGRSATYANPSWGSSGAAEGGALDDTSSSFPRVGDGDGDGDGDGGGLGLGVEGAAGAETLEGYDWTAAEPKLRLATSSRWLHPNPHRTPGTILLSNPSGLMGDTARSRMKSAGGGGGGSGGGGGFGRGGGAGANSLADDAAAAVAHASSRVAAPVRAGSSFAAVNDMRNIIEAAAYGPPAQPPGRWHLLPAVDVVHRRPATSESGGGGNGRSSRESGENLDDWVRRMKETSRPPRGGPVALSTGIQTDKLRRAIEGDVGPRYERSVAARRGAAGELSEMQQRMSALDALAGRHAQFKSADERDAWVAKELKTVESRASAKESAVSRVRAKRVKVGARIAASVARIAQCASELPAKEAELRTANTARTMGEAELDHLIDTRKGLWHKADGVLKQIRAEHDAAKKWQERFDRTRPRHVTTAMQSLRRIMQAARDASEAWVGEVHGPLIELFELDGDKFTTAVELTAHNALFNIVVDSEATATRLIERLRREKGGRLTFMPLDRIRAAGAALPPPDQASFVPLIDKISFDPVVAKAMQQVFGQTLLCRSREIAAQYAREYKIDCITLDGDQVNRRGALVGGYFDARSCRLKAHKQAGEARKAHVAIEREQQEIKRDLEKADRAILAARAGVETQRALAATLRLSVDELRKERERLNRRLRADKAEDTEADELASDEAELDELQSKIEALRAERGTPLVSKLSSAQQKELKAAEKALPKLEAADAAAETALEGALEKKRALEALLHSNLQRQLDELRQQLEEGGGEGDASQGKESGMLADERASVLASKEEALTRAVAATAVAEERLEAGRDELDAVRQRFHAAEARCEEARSQLARLVDQRQRQEKEFERVRVCAVPLLLVCAVTALDTQSDITVQSDIAHPRWIRAAPIAHPLSLSLSRTHARTACRQDSPRRGEARGRDA